MAIVGLYREITLGIGNPAIILPFHAGMETMEDDTQGQQAGFRWDACRPEGVVRAIRGIRIMRATAGMTWVLAVNSDAPPPWRPNPTGAPPIPVFLGWGKNCCIIETRQDTIPMGGVVVREPGFIPLDIPVSRFAREWVMIPVAANAVISYNLLLQVE